MKWDANPQDYAAVLVLIALYIFMEKGVGGANHDQLCGIVSKGNVSPGRVKFVTAELSDIEFVRSAGSDGQSQPKFEITHKGARWMEANFKVSRGDRFEFVARGKTVVLRDVGRLVETGQRGEVAPAQPSDWSKWGAIAAIIALPLAIFIWWFS